MARRAGLGLLSAFWLVCMSYPSVSAPLTPWSGWRGPAFLVVALVGPPFPDGPTRLRGAALYRTGGRERGTGLWGRAPSRYDALQVRLVPLAPDAAHCVGASGVAVAARPVDTRVSGANPALG